jgi:hypothetical protein
MPWEEQIVVQILSSLTNRIALFGFLKLGPGHCVSNLVHLSRRNIVHMCVCVCVCVYMFNTSPYVSNWS